MSFGDFFIWLMIAFVFFHFGRYSVRNESFKHAEKGYKIGFQTAKEIFEKNQE